MNKYKYTYYINNQEVDRATFEEELKLSCCKCDTNYDNPLLNISYLDTKKYQNLYRRLKEQKMHSYLFCNDFGGRGYRIKREVVNNG